MDGAADDGAVVGEGVADVPLQAEMRMADDAPSATSRFESCKASPPIDPDIPSAAGFGPTANVRENLPTGQADWTSELAASGWSGEENLQILNNSSV